MMWGFVAGYAAGLGTAGCAALFGYRLRGLYRRNRAGEMYR